MSLDAEQSAQQVPDEAAGVIDAAGAQSAVAGDWIVALAEQASLEFARAVYGLHDCASGQVDTAAAAAVRWAQAHGAVLTSERAEQRARAYLPVDGQEHCPRCWVMGGAKSLLRFAQARHIIPSVARCSQCGAEYANTGEG